MNNKYDLNTMGMIMYYTGMLNVKKDKLRLIHPFTWLFLIFVAPVISMFSDTDSIIDIWNRTTIY